MTRYGYTALMLLCQLSLFGQWAQTNFVSGYYATDLNVFGNQIVVNIGGAVFTSSDGGQTTEWITEGDGLPFAPYALVTESTLYLTTSTNRLYRTTDWGDTWQPAAFDPAPRSLSHFTDIFINDDGEHFAVTDGGQLYRSADGLAWREVTVDGPDLYPNQVLLSGLALGDTLLLGLAGGVFRSGDDGATWAYHSMSERGLQVNRLATTAAGQLYATTTGDGVFRSGDGGVTWGTVSEGLPDGERNIQDLEIVGGNTVYITTNADDETSNLYEFSAERERWQQLCAGEENTQVFIHLATDDTFLYASTVDNGIWKRPLAELTGAACGLTSATTAKFEETLRLYPNPVREQVVIDRDFSGLDIAYSIIDALGREVQRGHRRPTDDRMQIDLRQLPPGPYFLSLRTGKGDRYRGRLLKR
ncbi:putative secreted protein (Por secretion system target) [Neolewinella xylanilytica]|uniref:Putative secreted protein (Por secretion system target) n=1 Tax=Neolewinella xylanilytica TaxID=1514080 RepID=A0A2S6I1G1_9BACT|nr:T9SS type A sorting domain-containing protein [Neolewinella xylanilytica]PPK84809.1 putative secreted protein (Por secretion system target) [Neolewinella xylanilytica]